MRLERAQRAAKRRWTLGSGGGGGRGLFGDDLDAKPTTEAMLAQELRVIPGEGGGVVEEEEAGRGGAGRRVETDEEWF